MVARSRMRSHNENVLILQSGHIALAAIVALLATRLALAASSPPDVRDIMRRSIEAGDRNSEIERHYAFSNRTEDREVDANGKVKSIESKTYEAIFIEGRLVRKLVARNDKPLPAEERNKERDRLNKLSEERKKETAQQREKRLASTRQSREKEKEFNREILNAFDFRLAGEGRVDGRETWIIEAAPHPGYQPKDLKTQMLAHMKGKLWVDKQDYGWAKIDAEATDTISFGFVLARMEKGARFLFEQTWVNNEVWLPRSNRIRASARIGLIKKLQIDRETAFQNYRKIQNDRKIDQPAEP